MYRFSPGLLALVALAALSLAVLTACEKSNDAVAREQIAASQNACPKGCESPPPGCAIKGNISAGGQKVYHRPGGKNYDSIVVQPERGERWFCSEVEAIKNGWRLAAVEQQK